MENLEGMCAVVNWSKAFELAILFEFSGVLLRTKQSTIDAILIQWHKNDIYYCWWGTLSVMGHFPKLELPYV